ncbi:hypothetical protein AVEN_127778-1, partial [Araneus ventricosus]
SSYPQPSGGGGPTTVVVQQDRPGDVAGGGGCDFAMVAMGMLTGGALGTAWGSHHYGVGGRSTGGGWGHGPNVQDTHFHINNYDNDTITMNNNDQNTTNASIEQTASEKTAIEQTAIQQTVPEPAPVMAEQDYAPVAGPVEYLPMEDAGGGMFDGGDYDANFGGDFGGGDFGGGDFGGGDFGGGGFGAF